MILFERFVLFGWQRAGIYSRIDLNKFRSVLAFRSFRAVIAVSDEIAIELLVVIVGIV